MNLLIFGASGKTGKHILSYALVSGYSVTAFTRDINKIKLQHPDLKIIQGNVGDYNAVETAIKGQDVVLSALGADSPFKFDQVVVDGVGNIIKAMDSNGVNRLIYLSFIGVEKDCKDAGFFIRYLAPGILKTEAAGHRVREAMIEKSGLQWTIIHPPALNISKVKRAYRSGTAISSKGFFVSISRADVADFMLKQVTDSTYLRKKPRIMY
jgi:putative NADH-flavin reductase